MKINKKLRVGIGFDIHRFKKGRKLFLGGINIPYKLGLDGHSDADVLLHALCDALLGAMAKPDIGCNFPDTDPQHTNISSKLLLNKVMDMVRKGRFNLVNIDCIIIADEPKINIFSDKIQNSISKITGLNKDSIGIKAKTTEGILSFSGRGIAVYCATLLEKNK
jgi:2-C-methyl-D-erythritol 2,4-cyclodiphosphate synthase